MKLVVTERIHFSMMEHKILPLFQTQHGRGETVLSSLYVDLLRCYNPTIISVIEHLYSSYTLLTVTKQDF